MAMHQIKGYVYWQQTRNMAKPVFVFDRYDRRKWDESSRDGHVFIGEQTIEVEVPDDFDPRPQMVASLDAEIAQVRAAMSVRIKELQEQKNRLLALEMA